MSSIHAPHSPDILSQLLEPVGQMMPVKFAEELASMRAAPEVQAALPGQCSEAAVRLLDRGRSAEWKPVAQAEEPPVPDSPRLRAAKAATRAVRHETGRARTRDAGVRA